MRRAVALVLVALALAGCATAPPGPANDAPSTTHPSGTLAPLDAAPTFGPMVVAASLPTPNAEPMATIDTQGRIYADASGNDVIVRSDDDGRTFRVVSHVPQPEDGAVYAGPNGTVYASGLTEPKNGAIDITFYRSEDAGATWSEPVVLDHGNVDRQWFASAKPGEIVGVWRNRTDARDPFVAVRVSEDDGRTWSPEKRLAPDSQLPGNIIAGTDGAYYATYDIKTKYAFGVARSMDGGVTWTTTEVASPGGNIPVVAQDANGTLYVVFWRYDDTGGVFLPTGQLAASYQLGVWLTTSRDHGATWSAPLRVSPPDRNAILPWLVAGAPGRVALAWYEDSTGGTRSKPDAWFLVMSVASDADTASPHFHASRTTSDPIHVGELCSECGVFTTCNVPVLMCPGYYGPTSPRSRLDFLGLTIAKDGVPVVVYTNDRQPDAAALDLVASRPTNVQLR